METFQWRLEEQNIKVHFCLMTCVFSVRAAGKGNGVEHEMFLFE